MCHHKNQTRKLLLQVRYNIRVVNCADRPIDFVSGFGKNENASGRRFSFENEVHHITHTPPVFRDIHGVIMPNRQRVKTSGQSRFSSEVSRL
mmetsp:Transcript_19079/g.44450  ORF Transcript_19079/g.44450 Transcript_19079/m.44450 type:complete len:92 (-) Transcript_19079:1013-1288(-)